MKQLVWLAGVALALASTQSIQAIPVKATRVSVTGDAKLSTSSDAFAKSIMAGVSLTPTAKDRKVNVVRPMLSSLSLRDNLLGTTLVSRNNYIPDSLISKFDPKAQTEARRRTTPDPHRRKDPARVPDGGTTAGLLGTALLGTALMKRKLTA